jgi:DNA-binding IclR family transcriptional regulator
MADRHAGLRSVSIAASVLDCFAAHRELGATQVARELGVAKSTACRMLSALADGGLLDRAAGGRYRLSLRVFELGVLAAGHVAYIDRYGNTRLGSQLSGAVLRRVPGYSSSSGRVLQSARLAGWVGTREELTLGYSSVAAPVLMPDGTRPAAAISVVGPTARILGLRKDYIVASVCRAVQRVGALLAQATED